MADDEIKAAADKWIDAYASISTNTTAHKTQREHLSDAFAAGVAWATRPRVTAEEKPKEGEIVMAEWPTEIERWKMIWRGGKWHDVDDDRAYPADSFRHWWPLPSEVKP